MMGASDESPPMAADPAKVAAVIASLSEADRNLVLDLSGAWKLCTAEEVKPLNKLGLTAGRKTSFGGYAARLRSFGLAVRHELEGGDHAE